MKKTLVLMVAALAGCSLVPAYRQPDVPVGTGFAEQAAGGALPQRQLPQAWWTLYGSDALNGLVAEALKANTDLIQGRERVKQARAQLRIAGAGLWPTASAGAGVNDSLSGRSGNLAASVNGNVGYEVDLFGGNRASAEAARQGLKGTHYAQDALQLAVAGDTVEGYVALLALQERVRLAEDSLARTQSTQALVQKRFDAGVASGLQLAQQQTQTAGIEASIASLRQQEQAARHALAYLVGQVPSGFAAPSSTLASLALPEVDPAGPAAVLLQRPDVKQAEANLRAADANIGVARAALLPSLNVSLGALLNIDPAGSAVTLGASVLQPIFEGGRLSAQLDLSKARQRELAQAYRGTVLSAIKEVEDALSALNASRTRLDRLAAAQASAAKGEALSTQLLQVGSIDMLTLLDAQRSLISANDSLASAKADYANATVALIRALGGPWQAAE